MKKIIAIMLVALPIVWAEAQHRVKAGVIYQAGDTIESPLVGLKGVIPRGWYGTLPQGEEVFLLLPSSNKWGYMFIDVRQKSLDEINSYWHSPVQVAGNVTATLKGETTMGNDKLTGEFSLSGAEVPAVGYAEAIDGHHGYTFVFMLAAPAEQLDDYKKDFRALLDHAEIEAPGIAGFYDNFDWAKFLSSKYLASYSSTTPYQGKNEIWICPDGTFTTRIRSGGMIKGEKSKFRGNKKGTWTADGTGPEGTITLSYKKLGDLKLKLHIQNDQVFIEGERFFALSNANCQ